MRLFTLLFTVCLFACHESMGAEKSDFVWPESKISPIFKEFVTAYNTNDPNKLKTFTTKYFEKDHLENATYWQSVYADYGKIKPFTMAKAWSNENRLAIWFQGEQTKGWVMILLSLNEDNTKIVGKSVMRGLRPVGPLPPFSPISPEKMNAYLKKYLGKLYQLDRFSGSVLVAKGDKILFQETYGKRNEELNLVNDLNTTFNIASTTKAITAVAIGQLCEQGKLNYEDSISKFIQEYPKDIANQVTIHHLLTHTSGIELDDYSPFNQEVEKATSIKDLLNAQLHHIDSLNDGRRKDFKVLETHDYSNENYALLGVIIERVSGLSFGEYIEKNIFKPLGMNYSFADNQKIVDSSNKAIRYTDKNEDYKFVDGPRRVCHQMIPSLIDPFGGIYSTSQDLYVFFKSINEHKIITKKTQELLFQKHVEVYSMPEGNEYYGYGFVTSQQGKAVTIGHSGANLGVGSRFEYYPKEDYYVIILSNYGSMAGNIVADHIKDLINPNN